MAKRKLTRRQHWQIEKVQAERRERANKKDKAIDVAIEHGDLGPEQQGLIIAHYGSQIDVEALQGEHQGQQFRCKLRSNLGHLVTGDQVSWRQAADQSGVVVARDPRHSELSRPNKYGELKPIAANIDQIVVTIAPKPYAHANLVDRYLVAAEASDIEPIILLNKIDILDAEADAHIEPMLARYRQLGYRIIRASTKNQDGLAELLTTLDQRVSVFVGQSGVGKSSLVNVLLPGTDLKVSALSEYHEQGTHTTTTAKLFHFPKGGDLIDSPGIREFGLWHMDAETLIESFREFRPFLGYCKFSDCSHEHEPNCALLKALQDGDIDPVRLASYRSIKNSLDEFVTHQ
ncbi:MAG: small ribosomal subunit biogenesis GTPase RsgA [Gammaproteobacteria bacterium]|jgi:ribosome biogenesis GTPase|nr:small ribosomal subunit biogenesis GTPase RsgA [Gammaproteobacteria bacterium]MCP4880853.1 small ribosomal subunit biogenesis GTPase RsgA [Gammaproteobacteria bacterium]